MNLFLIALLALSTISVSFADTPITEAELWSKGSEQRALVEHFCHHEDWLEHCKAAAPANRNLNSAEVA
jgi:hypothetical protein